VIFPPNTHHRFLGALELCPHWAPRPSCPLHQQFFVPVKNSRFFVATTAATCAALLFVNPCFSLLFSPRFLASTVRTQNNEDTFHTRFKPLRKAMSPNPNHFTPPFHPCTVSRIVEGLGAPFSVSPPLAFPPPQFQHPAIFLPPLPATLPQTPSLPLGPPTELVSGVFLNKDTPVNDALFFPSQFFFDLIPFLSRLTCWEFPLVPGNSSELLSTTPFTPRKRFPPHGFCSFFSYQFSP